MSERTGRREFLRRLVATGAGAYGLSRLSQSSISEPERRLTPRSKVVIVRSSALGPFEGRPRPEQTLLAHMLDRGMKELTGERTATKAWAKTFAAQDLVGIKVNCLGGPRCSTRPELADAIAAGVQLAGVTPGDITIWDRRSPELEQVGFTLNRDGAGVRCYGTDGDYGEEVRHRSFRGRLSRLFTERTTALVNAPILKDHNSAGVTIALKNHYGTCHNPAAHHANNCHPYIADLNHLPAIRNKTRLIVCDAIQAVCEGGPDFRAPEYLWDYRGIILSFDPVAVDFVGWGLIEQRRREIGLPSLAESGREPKWIAAAESLGLGAAREDGIELVEISV